MPVLDPHALIDHRVQAIQQYHAATGLDRAELDLSGGIDSAVMAGLLRLALGPDRLTLVYSSINSGSETRDRAQALADGIGVPLVVHDLTDTYQALIEAMISNLESAGFERAEVEAGIRADNTVLGSIRSCIRAPLGRGYLRMTGNGLRHGTGNECEDRWLRFYQKGGDGEVDSNPIAMLAKGEVFQLAKALGERLNAEAAYRRIIDAAPTPELWGAGVAHTDEDEIGSYLGIEHSGESFYSYIDAESGAYTSVGLIERVARFVDTPEGQGLFRDDANAAAIDAVIQAAQTSPVFAGVAPDTVERILQAARRTERVTRHKENPNCPTLGTRGALVAAGILTDSLPAVQ
ncbi:MAG: hypothetical protein VX944_02075 [Myxococcota bacterium]|nr:hypothetical protein [Myxococcota bacterium]MEC9388838.1 hypothetical protein [Myxococcota bacterium]